MGKKILLADDSITIQKVIELTFSDEDFDVVTVGNGRLALEKLPEVRPDIVLCDIIMPEKDGYEVCDQIKRSAAFGHLPVLLLTGAFEPFDQERAAQVGSDGFLAKPFEPETLIAKVKDLLSRAGSAPDTVAPAAMAEATQVPEAAPLEAALSAGLAPAPPALSPAIEPPALDVVPASPSFIPDEPFESFDAGAIEEASATAVPEAPLAAVTAEESATLAGDFAGDLAEDLDAGQSAPDSASTVMFNAGDLPWTGGESAAPEPPAVEEPVYESPAALSSESAAETAVAEPEPVLTPDPAEEVDLADAAGAAFEEVLEEDLEFSGRGAGDPPAAEPAMLRTGGSGLADSAATQTQAPVAPGGPFATDESPTLKVAVPALPEDVAFGHPAGESGPVETFEPAPLLEPEAPPAHEAPPAPAFEPGPVEAYEPVAPLEPEAPPAYELPSAPVFEPEPVETFEPVAPLEPEAAPVFEPEPVETFEPEEVESFEPEPEPAAPPAFEPAPAYDPEEVESFEPEPEPEPAPPPMFEPAAAPVFETEAVETFEPVPPPEAEAVAGPAFEPAPAYEPEPVETFEPIPPPEPETPPAFESAPAPAYEPVPPPAVSFEPAPAPVLEPEEEFEDALEPVTSEGTSTLPGTTRADVVESFSDLGPGDEPDPAASEAAAVPVPVDMVEKIAQRVVAQVSEKAVREIAWEVIPDLAEALIKQEIERLKAELQKL